MVDALSWQKRMEVIYKYEWVEWILYMHKVLRFELREGNIVMGKLIVIEKKGWITPFLKVKIDKQTTLSISTGSIISFDIVPPEDQIIWRIENE